MKENKFMKKYPKEEIVIPIYFTLDDKENVIIDYEEMQKEFNDALRDILLEVNPESLD